MAKPVRSVRKPTSQNASLRDQGTSWRRLAPSDDARSNERARPSRHTPSKRPASADDAAARNMNVVPAADAIRQQPPSPSYVPSMPQDAVPSCVQPAPDLDIQMGKTIVFNFAHTDGLKVPTK
ncbi:hypothetical protein BT69DRAFT_1328129 [Atractiella rhizophila]|nr:hypothetical protein BT69DRAFT_1328129 [Atractiella rhizophila]